MVGSAMPPSEGLALTFHAPGGLFKELIKNEGGGPV